MTHAAVYTRVSTGHQAKDGFGLEEQRETLVALVESKGWTYELFEDAGISGEKLEEREALVALLAAVDEGRFGAVVVYDEDRLARDEQIGVFIRYELAAAGVTLVTRAGEHDLSNPDTRLMVGLKNLLAAAGQAKRTARMKAGRRRAAAAGYWVGGPPPFGYQVVPDGAHKRLALDPDEAEVVRTLVDLVVDHGCTTHEAALRMNALGHSAPGVWKGDGRQPSEWTHRKVRRVLDAEILGGTWTFGVSRGRDNGDPVTVELPDDERLLTRERYAQLRAFVDSTAFGPRRTTEHTYPLSGRLFGLCGQPYYGTYRKDRDYREYICKGRAADIPLVADRCDDRRWRSDDLDEAVWSEVVGLLGQPERLLRLAADALAERGEQVAAERDRLEQLDSKLAELNRNLTERVKEYARAGLPADVLTQATQELTAEREALVRQRAQVAAWHQHNAGASERKRRLWELAEVAQERLANASPELRKKVAGLLDLRVQTVEHATRSASGKVSVEGVVWEQLLEATGGAFSQVGGKVDTGPPGKAVSTVSRRSS